MTKEDLLELKRKLALLSDQERKERDLYLRGLANGEIQGPSVGYASIDKPWLKYYPESGINEDIPKVTAYQLIYDKMCQKTNYIALDYFGKKITYKEVFENIEKVAKSLKQLGVKKGDIVTMAMPTSPETVYLFYALNRIGAISNCIDPRMTVEGFVASINSTKSKHLIAVDICDDIVKAVTKQVQLNSVVSVSALESAPLMIKLLGRNKKESQFINWQQLIKLGKNYIGPIDEPYEENSAITIVHTGGTTGKSKGVVLTNENFNTMAVTQRISDLNLEEKDTFLTFLPPFTAYCLVNAIHDPLYLGFENALVPKFSPEDFPKLMKKYKPNHVLSGPILWDGFIKSKLHQKANLRYLKSPISGGDSLNVELEKQINEFFAEHNCNYPITQGYGMTEISAAAVYSKTSSYKEGSVGIPYIKNNVGIFDPETGDELGYNQEGEICISSPTIMKEYYNNPVETEKVIQIKEDGLRWIRTGDIGKIDEDGNLFVIGRIKRMIVRSGNKIFPSTVENIMMRSGAIENCAIVQMDDSVERHIPVAHVVIKEEFRGIEDTIVEKIEEEIAKELPSYNLPATYVFRDNLPLTGLQKIDFKKLEEESKACVIPNRKINIQTTESSKTFKKDLD